MIGIEICKKWTKDLLQISILFIRQNSNQSFLLKAFIIQLLFSNFKRFKY